MAMCACSLNHSPTTPSVSLYAVPSKPSIQIPQPSLSSSSPSSSSSYSCRHNSLIVSEDSLMIGAIAEAAALANAAAQAAKHAVSSALALDDEIDESGNWIQMSSSNQEHAVAGSSKRRRRRKRKKQLEISDADSSSYFIEQCSSRSARSRYLTPREEAEFSLYLKEGAMLEAESKKMHKTREGDPSKSEWAVPSGMERRKAEKVFLRARECRERITLSYKRLVLSIAAPYQGKGLSLQDLTQEGFIGLLQGAERFDSKKGYKLSTYVYWWIKQAIIKAVAKNSRIVRLPGNMHGVAAKVAEANTSLRRRLGRWPTYEEIADLVDVGASSVRLVCERSRQPISIDQPVTRGGVALKDIIPAPDETRPEAIVSRQLMLQNMEKLLKTLSEREEYILRLHYGLNGETARSCDEIGKLLNLSRERIRQIHCMALTRLREKKDLMESLKQWDA